MKYSAKLTSVALFALFGLIGCSAGSKAPSQPNLHLTAEDAQEQASAPEEVSSSVERIEGLRTPYGWGYRVGYGYAYRPWTW